MLMSVGHINASYWNRQQHCIGYAFVGNLHKLSEIGSLISIAKYIVIDKIACWHYIVAYHDPMLNRAKQRKTYGT